MTRTCLHCGDPLPPISWWRRVFTVTMPVHPPHETCWIKFNHRMGITDPGPMPGGK